MDMCIPTIETINTDDGPKFRVCGLGYCTLHGQEWQARIMWECLAVSAGVATPKCVPPVLGNKTPDV
jgi:hypothetical protein